MKERSGIPRKGIRILKHGEDIGSSRDWLIGEGSVEKKIIQVLSTVFKITITDLAHKIKMRKNALKRILMTMEKKGWIILENGDDGKMYVRLSGYIGGEEVDGPMYA